jgi:hypothetical protein
VAQGPPQPCLTAAPAASGAPLVRLAAQHALWRVVAGRVVARGPLKKQAAINFGNAQRVLSNRYVQGLIMYSYWRALSRFTPAWDARRWSRLRALLKQL